MELFDHGFLISTNKDWLFSIKRIRELKFKTDKPELHFFVSLLLTMRIDLYINEANDYARDIGAPVWHPHVSVIHYDEAGEIRHTLNRINCYGIFLQDEFPEGLTYGVGTYHDGDGSLMAYSPGQIGGKRDDGTRRQYHGWVLLFDSEFIHGMETEQKMDRYQFFSYQSNEALILTPDEKDILSRLMANLRGELETQAQAFGHNDIIRNYIQLILDYCNRFYFRQFREMSADGSDILSRFQQVLTDYYSLGLQKTDGLPSVKYCAGELCLSPGYSHSEKAYCTSCSIEEILENHDKCYYHKHCGYFYWNIMDAQSSFFCGKYEGNGCPFRGGMNQLWRNQMLPLELENRGVFEEVYFSVVSHPDNSFLDKTMNEYRALINNSPKFYNFKSNALVDVAVDYLPDWSNWYKKVYLGID